jgi:hypothetical protein
MCKKCLDMPYISYKKYKENNYNIYIMVLSNNRILAQAEEYIRNSRPRCLENNPDGIREHIDSILHILINCTISDECKIIMLKSIDILMSDLVNAITSTTN